MHEDCNASITTDHLILDCTRYNVNRYKHNLKSLPRDNLGLQQDVQPTWTHQRYCGERLREGAHKPQESLDYDRICILRTRCVSWRDRKGNEQDVEREINMAFDTMVSVRSARCRYGSV